MKKQIFTVFTFLLIGTFNLGIAQSQVKYYGKLKSIMQGDISTKFDLQELENENNIFGLGAVEQLKGEITIINGKPFITTVKDSNLDIKQDYKKKAALLIYTKVNKWKPLDLNQRINSVKDLEKFLSKQFEKDSSSVDQPIPFLIKGEIKSLSWHVIDWAEGDSVHTHKKHKTSGLHGTIENTEITIIGFYSTNHHGIITHRNSDVHMHFVTEDKKLSGHVDEVSFDDTVLYFHD